MRVAVLAVMALLAAGCMNSSSSGGSATTTPNPQPSGAPQTFLTVVIWPKGKKGRDRPQVFRLSCRGGEAAPGPTKPIPNKPRACRRVFALGVKGFANPARDVACTQIYGGPQVAEVSGSIEGRLVKATFARADGCEIARWNRFRFLLPVKT